MKKKSFKLFRNQENNIVGINYSNRDQQQYFSFIKEQQEKGFYQVIITSRLMLKILEKYFLEYNYKIEDLRFEEDDEEVEKQKNYILDEIENDRGYFIKLVDKLKFLSKNLSIDIYEMSLTSLKTYGNIKIKVNGIINTDDIKFDEIENICEIIKENIWKS